MERGSIVINCVPQTADVSRVQDHYCTLENNLPLDMLTGNVESIKWRMEGEGGNESSSMEILLPLRKKYQRKYRVMAQPCGGNRRLINHECRSWTKYY